MFALYSTCVNAVVQLFLRSSSTHLSAPTLRRSVVVQVLLSLRSTAVPKMMEASPDIPAATLMLGMDFYYYFFLYILFRLDVA